MDAVRSPLLHRHMLACVAILGSWSSLAAADDTAAPEPAAPTFQPGDISIGEPIPLPFSPPSAQPVPAAAPQAGPTPPADFPAADRVRAQPPATAAVPGTGWVGLTVAESNVPGRWRVDDVATGGPAARAGIVVGDELRAVNGIAITSADAVAQALTAIAAGQDVRVAVARGDGVRDLTLRADPRPSTPARDWQPAASTEPPARAPAPPPGVAAFATAPAQVLPPPVLEPPASTTPATGLEPRPPATAATEKRRAALGVRTVPIDAATQSRFRLQAPTGAYVIGVVQDLPAAKAGVPPGSVIVALGDRPVRSPVELTQLVTSGPVDRPVSLEFVLPGGEARRADVVLQALDAPLERALVSPLAPAAVPDLDPGPTAVRSERPAPHDDEIRAEIRRLRARLDRLERSLDAGPVGHR